MKTIKLKLLFFSVARVVKVRRVNTNHVPSRRPPTVRTVAGEAAPATMPQPVRTCGQAGRAGVIFTHQRVKITQAWSGADRIRRKTGQTNGGTRYAV
jgi:hypothetical protein